MERPRLNEIEPKKYEGLERGGAIETLVAKKEKSVTQYTIANDCRYIRFKIFTTPSVLN
jgi:hypothetical protein